jgi:hypothetical protein
LTTKLFLLLLACACMAPAQLRDYLGPGVLTRGAGSIGQRSGQDVDLRFFANVTGAYDTGLQPTQLDSEGNLIRVDGLYGLDLGFGVYGRHNWQRSVLGLDYRGNYRHYQGNSRFNGSNHSFGLGYTYQQSRRVVFDVQGSAGTSNFGTNFIDALPPTFESVVDSTSFLYDNRTHFMQGGMDVNYLLSPRTTFTAGGSAYTVRRQYTALVGVNGYTLSGRLSHRLSELTSVAAAYERTHYDFPRAFGESDIDRYNGQIARQFGRAWTASVAAGIYRAEVQGLQRVAVDPVIAALLGISSSVETFYRKNTLPYGSASLSRQFRNAVWTVSYSRTIGSGNGVYLTSAGETVSSSISYTGLRKWSFSLSGARTTLRSIGQDLQRYGQYYGATDVSYTLMPSLFISASFGMRYQNLDISDFRRTSSRSSVSIVFSPGEIPVSFH